VMAAFKDRVEKLLPGVPPTSALGKALSYTMNQWPKLVRHPDHPEVAADSLPGAREIANLTERTAGLATTWFTEFLRCTGSWTSHFPG
jgi:hypothetical protein